LRTMYRSRMSCRCSHAVFAQTRHLDVVLCYRRSRSLYVKLRVPLSLSPSLSLSLSLSFSHSHSSSLSLDVPQRSELSVSCRIVFRWLADRGCRETSHSYDIRARDASYELNRIITPTAVAAAAVACPPECFEWNIRVTSAIIIALVPRIRGIPASSLPLSSSPPRRPTKRRAARSVYIGSNKISRL